MAAFPFFLTIPGWIALGSYRKWRDGRLSRPNFAFFWAGLFTVLLAVGIVGAIIAAVTQ